MTSVKLTFEKGQHGNRITIVKEGGGFTLEEMTRVTQSIEAMFASEPDEADEQEEEEEIDEVEQDVEDVDEDAIDKAEAEGNKEEENEAIKQQAKEEGKKIDTTRKTKDGTIDQRQLNRGQGRAGGETKEEHNKTRKDGEVDRRTTRAQRTPEDLKNEPFMKRLQQNGGSSSRGTDRAGKADV